MEKGKRKKRIYIFTAYIILVVGPTTDIASMPALISYKISIDFNIVLLIC